ncbi:MAG TPA: hypothetical protein VM070_03455 [Candidatus Saccharimonadales bacterium]|nr:hypothetical protein [Candidatus Saccharimonadales bacterium]
MDRAAFGMALGGVLWVIYGVFEMLEPFGAAKRYDPALGYELVTDPARYIGYGIPGAAALILSGVGLARRRAREAGPIVGLGRLLASAVVLAGGLSCVGLAVRSAPLFFGPVALGTPVLGAAAGLLAIGPPGAARADRGVLLLISALGLFTLPLRPLVYALHAIPPAGGAVALGLFGFGWVVLGWRASRGRRAAGPSPAAPAA